MIPRSFLLAALGGIAVLCLANSAHATTINYPDSPTPVPTTIETTLADPISLSIISGSAIQSGAISGDGSITKIGAGTISLTGTNTFSGPLAINAGTISASNSSALGSGDLAFDGGTLTTTTGMVLTKNTTLNAGGATFALSNGFFTLNGNVSGAGGLTKNGTSILTLNGAHTYTGATTVNGGILKFAANGATASTVATSGLAIASGARVIFENSQTYAGTVTGAGVLEHDFTGTTILTGAASHTGGTNIVGGAIQIGNGGNTGSLSGNVALSGGGTLAFNRSNAASLGGVISGAGNVTQLGTGTTTLSGANTYTGITTVSGGTLQFAKANSLLAANWTATNLIVNAGATAAFNVGGTNEFTAADITTLKALGTGTGGFKDGSFLGLDTTNAGGNFAYSTAIANPNGGSNALGLVKLGTGKLTLSGANTYSGGTVINTGTLGFDSAGAIGSGAITLGGGVLQASAADLVIPNALNTTTGTSSGIDTNGHTITVNGAISGTGAQIIKTGAGTLAFTAATNHVNSFFVNGGDVHQSTGTSLTSYEIGVGSGGGNTGIYNLDGGTLSTLAGTPPQPAGGSASSFRVGDFGGTGTVNQTGGIVTNNGSLNIGNQGGHGTYNLSAGELHLASGQSTLGRTGGSSLSSGGSTGALNLSGTGLLSIENDSILTLSNWYPYSGGGTQGAGVLTQTGGTLAVAAAARLYLAGSGTGAYNLNGGTLQVGGASLQSNYPGQSGPYQLNLGGGAIQATGSTLTTDVNATLTNATTSTINTNGLGATFSGVLGGSGNLTKTGAGTLTLSGANTFSGGTTINAGTLQISGGSALGNNAQVTLANVAGATLQLAASETIGALSGGGALGGNVDLGANVLTVGGNTTTTFAGTISGAGSLVKTGNGTLTLSGVNTFDETEINQGTLSIASPSALGSGLLVFTGGTLQTTASFTLDRGMPFAGTFDVATGTTLTVTSSMGGSAPLTKSGAGTLVLQSGGYAGETNIDGGTLSISSSGVLGSAVNLTGTLAVTQTTTIGSDKPIRALGGVFDVAAAKTLTVDSEIQLFNYTKSGAGTMVLTGTNSNDGVTVDGGTLSISSNANLGIGGLTLAGGTLRTTANVDLSSRAISIAAASAFEPAADTTLTLANLSSASLLTKKGDGTLLLNGASTALSNGLTIEAGTVTLAGGTITGAIANSGSLVLTRSGDFEIGGLLSGGGSLRLAGSGAVSLTNSGNTYSGGTVLESGTLSIASAEAIGSGSLQFLGGSLRTTGDFTLGNAVQMTNTAGFDVTDGTLTVPASFGSGTPYDLVKSGGGTLVLGGSNGYSGGTSLLGGTLSISSNANIGSGTLYIENATLRTTADLTLSRTLNFSNGTFDVAEGTTNTISSSFGNNSPLTKTGAGKLLLTGANDFVTVTINDGTLALGSSDALGTGSISFGTDTGILQYSAANTVDYSSRFSTAGGQVIGIDTNGQAITFATALNTDNGSNLRKLGAGSLTLSGSNSFYNLTVENGSLAIPDGVSVSSLAGYINSTPVIGPAAPLAVVNISGPDASWTVGSSLAIGRQTSDPIIGDSGGTLNISQGASVSANVVNLGVSATVSDDFTVAGTINVTGPGSSLVVSNLISMASGGAAGNLAISDGASVSTSRLSMGSSFFSGGIHDSGTVTISGAGSSLTALSLQAGARSGPVSISVSDGAQLTSGSIGQPSTISNSDLFQPGASVVTISGAGSQWTANIREIAIGDIRGFGVIYGGEGELTVADHGKVTVQGGTNTIRLSSLRDIDSKGTLNIGAAAAAPAAAAGFVSADAITTGVGTGIVQFNTTGTALAPTYFTADGTATGTATPLTGTLSVVNTAGTTVLKGTNSYTGGNTINGGTLIGNASSIKGDIANHSAVIFDQATDGTHIGAISGEGSFTKTGAGVLSLAGASTYTGATTISEGTLLISGYTPAGSTPALILDATSGVATDSGAVTSWADLSGFGNNAAAAGGNVTLGTLANGRAALVFDGSSWLADPLSSSGSAYTVVSLFESDFIGGNQSILGSSQNNALQFRVDEGGYVQYLAQFIANLGSASAPVSVSRTNFVTATIADGAQSFYLGTSPAGTGGGGYAFDPGASFRIGTNGQVDESLSGKISLLLVYDSVLTPEQIAAVQSAVLTAWNNQTTYVNPTSNFIPGSLPSATALNITTSGAALDLGGHNQTIGSLAGVVGSKVYLGSARLTAGGDNTSTTFAGVLQDGGASAGLGGSFVKSGTGTLTISGNNTYTGPTTINAGKLVVDGSLSASSAVTINTTGTLGGHGTVGAVAISDGGKISPGNSPGTLITGAETWNGGGGYVWELNNASDDYDDARGVSYDWLDIRGMLTLNNTSDNKFTIYVTSLTGANVAGVTPGFVYGTTYHWVIASSATAADSFTADKFAIDTSAFFNDPTNLGGFTITQVDNDLLLNYTAVPEPSTYAIAIATLLGGIILLRRRR